MTQPSACRHKTTLRVDCWRKKPSKQKVLGEVTEEEEESQAQEEAGPSGQAGHGGVGGGIGGGQVHEEITGFRDEGLKADKTVEPKAIEEHAKVVTGVGAVGDNGSGGVDGVGRETASGVWTINSQVNGGSACLEANISFNFVK